ncbi:MAG: argininosuccinate lyase [Tritonibacter mobilis]|nr:argininosuccinate lyase [Tritonibacter mobilis]NKX36973.1 argininosuccinate lyase [Rhodobacteraceae bacterium R_SAG4]
MIRVVLFLCLAVVAACDNTGAPLSDPAEPTTPGIHISGEARVGVVYGD